MDLQELNELAFCRLGDAPEYVYFIACGVTVTEHLAYVKIGTSSNPQQRLKDLQTASPFPYELIHLIHGNATTEKAVHRLFDEYRMRGMGEWFYVRGELKIFLRKCIVFRYSYLFTPSEQRALGYT